MYEQTALPRRFFKRRHLWLSAAALVTRSPRARAELRNFIPACADDLVQSVGVGVHLESSPYRAQRNAVMRALIRLGVRHLRDELRPDNDLRPWQSLYREAGIRGHLLVSPVTNTVPAMLDYIDALGVERLSAIEGQNEGDSDWFRAQPSAGRDWAATVIGYQARLHAALRARFSADQLPVVSPTVLDYKPGDMRALRPAAAFCDIVGVHAYPQEQQEPETEDDYAALRWYLREMRDGFKPGAACMITEAGYYGGAAGVPPSVTAKYLPRLLLHAHGLGVGRTFLYELLDEGRDTADSEQNYGLLAVNGAPKPAYHALRSMLHALADPGPRFTPAPLAIGLEGAPADLRIAAFQKRGGEQVLAMWRALRSWDPVSKRAIEVPGVPVRLLLPTGVRAAILPLEADRAWSDVDPLDVVARDTVTLVRLVA